MMDILDKIVVDKKRELHLKKTVIPLMQLETSLLFQREPVSLANVIAE